MEAILMSTDNLPANLPVPIPDSPNGGGAGRGLLATLLGRTAGPVDTGRMPLTGGIDYATAVLMLCRRFIADVEALGALDMCPVAECSANRTGWDEERKARHMDTHKLRHKWGLS
jgi:hypothetical protein